MPIDLKPAIASGRDENEQSFVATLRGAIQTKTQKFLGDWRAARVTVRHGHIFLMGFQFDVITTICWIRPHEFQLTAFAEQKTFFRTYFN